jgi:hypothetical protein
LFLKEGTLKVKLYEKSDIVGEIDFSGEMLLYRTMSHERRNQRLIADSFARASADGRGIDDALKSGRPYQVNLTGLSLRSLAAAFNSVVNLFDPPRHLQSFRPEDIARDPAFENFRDRLNERGLDLSTTKGHYNLFIDNIHYGRANFTPYVRFYIVPWDGEKKSLEPYDLYKHSPPAPRRLFY